MSGTNATSTATIGSVLYPVRDLTQAKQFYRQLLGTAPHVDSPYYVGFQASGLEVGLVPNGQDSGMPGSVAYWQVADIEQRVRQLVEAGAEVQDEIRHVGGGRRVAAVKDADGNVIGLMQDS